eukprot:m51a1_g1095 putative casein kinase i isoform delta-like (739) ;mRNA; f:73387-78343
MELRVGGKYRLGRKIGGGSFGDIYLGVNITNGEEFAVKLEPVKSKHPQLFYEYKLYKILQGGVGIPVVTWFGIEGDYNVMVMDLLGPSLEDLFNFCGQHFSLKTVLMLGDQLLRRVVHGKNFIHRDIKPDNFLMGVGPKSSQVYIIDFGLAKKYRDSKTHQHIQYRENKSLTGTARYASINTHLGIEQSRRDDLESLAYVLIYFYRGCLPWQGLKADNKRQKYERISEKKLATTVEQLCKGFPPEFATFLTYCKSLHFEDKPDYAYLRKLLRNLFIKEGYKYDGLYDWTMVHLNSKGPERPLPIAEGGADKEDAGAAQTPGGAAPVAPTGRTMSGMAPPSAGAPFPGASSARMAPDTAGKKTPSPQHTRTRIPTATKQQSPPGGRTLPPRPPHARAQSAAPEGQQRSPPSPARTPPPTPSTTPARPPTPPPRLGAWEIADPYAAAAREYARSAAALERAFAPHARALGGADLFECVTEAARNLEISGKSGSIPWLPDVYTAAYAAAYAAAARGARDALVSTADPAVAAAVAVLLQRTRVVAALVRGQSETLAGFRAHVAARDLCAAPARGCAPQRPPPPTPDAAAAARACESAFLGACVAKVAAHQKKVTSLARVGEQVWSASEDNTIAVWDARTAARLSVMEGHAGAVYGFAVMPDQVWSCSWDKTMMVWDPTTFRRVGVVRGYHSSTVRTVAACEGPEPGTHNVWSASYDQALCVWSCRRVPAGMTPIQLPAPVDT